MRALLQWKSTWFRAEARARKERTQTRAKARAKEKAITLEKGKLPTRDNQKDNRKVIVDKSGGSTRMFVSTVRRLDIGSVIAINERLTSSKSELGVTVRNPDQKLRNYSTSSMRTGPGARTVRLVAAQDGFSRVSNFEYLTLHSCPSSPCSASCGLRMLIELRGFDMAATDDDDC